MRYWAVKLTAAAAAARMPRPVAAVRSHWAEGSRAGREPAGELVLAGPVSAKGKTGARASAPTVRCGPECPAPATASAAR